MVFSEYNYILTNYHNSLGTTSTASPTCQRNTHGRYFYFDFCIFILYFYDEDNFLENIIFLFFSS